MDDFKRYLDKRMKNDNFRKEYEALAPEAEIVRAIIDARKKENITQKELAKRTGIAQSDISKLENGSGNPSIQTLQRLADGLGMEVKIKFIQKQA